MSDVTFTVRAVHRFELRPGDIYTDGPLLRRLEPASDGAEAIQTGDTVYVRHPDEVWLIERRVESSGVDRIAAERLRQIEQEGWTAAHDDGKRGGTLATAATCYALDEADRTIGVGRVSLVRLLWPWEWHRFKPSNRIRDLEKAGALIAAEIDRLTRAKA